MNLTGLSRQIALSMMAMALGVTLLVVVTSYAFYFLVLHYWPEHLSEPGWIPTGPELAWLIATTLTALALAGMVALRLAQRILVPLNSVAGSMRRLARGDLDARASAGDHSLGEASQLAEDFNELARQLQRVTQEQTFWNAAIAHELRTPVTILKGRLQGLADGIFVADASQFRSLLSQVEGLARLIEDLRVVSLAESGHLDLQWRQVDLAVEVENVAQFADEALRSAGQHLVLECHGVHAHCDPQRMRQAMLALLDNARRHASPGAVRIRANLSDGWCSLSVEDSGPGIPEEFLPYVFTAFRRAPVNAGNNRHGNGLGLAVVAAIAQAHGGKASCHAIASGGTRFSLCWPDAGGSRSQPNSTVTG